MTNTAEEQQSNQLQPQNEQTQNNLTPQQQPKGAVSRMADTWKKNNLGEKIGNAMVGLGSAAQVFAHGATGGKYGTAWGDTVAGTRQQQNFQRGEREGTQNWQTDERQGADQQQLAMQNLQHNQGLEVLGQQQNFQADQAGLDRQQAQDILRLNKELSVKQQREIYEAMAMMGNDKTKQQGMALMHRAMAGVTDAEFYQRMANLTASTAASISREIRAWVPGLGMQGTNVSDADASQMGKNPVGTSSDISAKTEIEPTWKPKPFWHKKESPRELTRDDKLARLKKWG